MRPDKKKKNRGKYADKTEETQAQSKNVVSKLPEKKEAPKTNLGEPSEKTESTDKATSTATTTPASEVPTENLPPANLRRETDALKEAKKPSKRQIFSDWKEYDKPILPEEIEEEQLRDFSSLIQQSITADNYFKFKHERQWESDTCNINKDLFNLNLQELSSGLQCIPFYERLNISRDLFSENEVKRMENIAKQQEKLYEGILNSHDSNPIYLDPEILLVERSDKVMEEGCTLEIVSDGGSIQSENELVKCLTREKQDIADEAPLIQPKESKVEGPQCDFFNDDVKSLVEDIARKEISVENKSQPIKEEKDRNKETIISTTSTPINEAVVKCESNEVIAASVVKPPEDTPLEAGAADSCPLDMATVFETEPLGQRKKPQRSRESKAKSRPKVVTSGEEEQILDSLLSLKEPTIIADDSKKKEMEEVENEADGLTNDLKSIVIHDKKENLEAWLDSMLDD